jgi:uncharacterized protein YlxP (DUF503 family)
MYVGAALVELHVHGSRSLKQKRGVVKSITARVRNRFNVSIAEVGGQDTWQRAVLGVSAAGAEAERVRVALERVVDFIENLHLAELRGSDVQVLGMPQQDSFENLQEDEPLPWEGAQATDDAE